MTPYTDTPEVSDATNPATSGANAPININLREIVRKRLGKKSWLVPLPLVRWLEKTICQKQLNSLLANNFPKTGADFCRGVMADLNITLNVKGKENLPPPAQRKVIIVSNHPLGGLDGIALIDFFQNYYGGKIHFLVNDLLMAIKPLEDVFVPVNKHGSQSRQYSQRVNDVLAGPDPVLIFPAGLCSRRQDDGTVADLQWRKTFVVKALQHNRDIIPVHFDGRNSDFFYKFANLRKKSGLKFNVEMIYLPREVFRSQGNTFTLSCGKPIICKSLGPVAKAQATADSIRETVYRLRT